MDRDIDRSEAQVPHARQSFVDTLQVAGGLASSLPAVDAVAAFADYYDGITREALALGESRLGEPPCAYAWLALGSHGRREPSLSSDQDNALVMESDTDDALRYGRALAAIVIRQLDDAGMRPCDGGYMADTWCYGLAAWRKRLADMFSDPSPQDVVDADVLLDLRPVAGSLDVGELTGVMLDAARSARLLQGLAAAAVTFPSGLNQFGRVRLVRGAFDAKKGGLAPVVMLARLYAFSSGRVAPTTVERLSAATRGDQLSPDATRRLLAAHHLLTKIRLAQQVHDAERAVPITDWVPKDALAPADLSDLHRALRAIKEAQQVTALRFRTTERS